jgi:hypothetical protein
MTLPNAAAATIAADKLRDYLLNIEHPRGRTKARLLLLMGFSPDRWEELERALRIEHLTQDVSSSNQTEYGTRFTIVAPLTGPLHRKILFRSVWQIDLGDTAARLITMYPEDDNALSAL